MMESLVRELLPTAPDFGLFVAPDIPADKLHAAIADYAPTVDAAAVLALYDATRLGSAKDGALFLDDHFVFQNNDLHAPRVVRYEDLVGVRSKKRMLGGRDVELDVNRARATFKETIDFSAKPGAAEYVERFLHEAMIRSAALTAAPGHAAETDVAAVRAALDALVADHRLAPGDRDKMMVHLEA